MTALFVDQLSTTMDAFNVAMLVLNFTNDTNQQLLPGAAIFNNVKPNSWSGMVKKGPRMVEFGEGFVPVVDG